MPEPTITEKRRKSSFPVEKDALIRPKPAWSVAARIAISPKYTWDQSHVIIVAPVTLRRFRAEYHIVRNTKRSESMPIRMPVAV